MFDIVADLKKYLFMSKKYFEKLYKIELKG